MIERRLDRMGQVAPGLLAGYRCLDLADEKGMFCGQLLSHLGVDVIKVEKPGGDSARRIGPFYKGVSDPERSLLWFAANVNKRGITLDIEKPEGRQLLLKLVEKTDFLIESFPPGYLEHMELGWSLCSEVNPRLVLTSITAFGQSGPHSRFKTTDLIAMATGGWLYMCGDEDRPPVRFSAEQAYFQAGAQAAVGTLLAHLHREVTGEGQHVDVSIQEAVACSLGYPLPYWFTARRLFPRTGFRHKRINVTYRRLYPCKDGYVSATVGLGLMLGPMQARLVEAMEQEGMAGDMKEVDWRTQSLEAVPQAKIDHWESLMAAFFAKHTRVELHEIAIKHNLVVCPVNNLAEVLGYEQLRVRNYWSYVEHPEVGDSLPYPGYLFRLHTHGEVTATARTRAPLIGEHNAEIYENELGLSRNEVMALKKGGVI